MAGDSATGFEAKRTWPLWGLAAVTVVWLIISVAGRLPGAAAALPGGDGLLATASAVFPPVIVLLLLVAFLPMRKRPLDVDDIEFRVDSAIRSAADLEEQLVRIDRTLGFCTEKVARLSAAAASDGEGLGATAQALEVAAGTMALSSSDMKDAVERLLDTMPSMTAQARDAEALLRTAGGQAAIQIQAVDGALAAIAARSTDAGIQAETSIASMQKLLAQIDSTSGETTKAIANRAYTLDAAVTGVLDRSSAAFNSIGETLQEYSQRFEAMLAAARSDADSFGNEGTRVIGQRLDVLLGAANQLKLQLGEQQAMSDRLLDRASANFAAIEARLGELNGGQQAATDAVEARTIEHIAAIETKLEQLRERQQQTGREIEEQAGATVLAIEQRLGELRDSQIALAGKIQDDASANIAAIELRLGDLRAAQQDVSEDLQAKAAAAIAAMEARLEDFRAVGDARLGDTSERIARTIAEIDEVGAALSARQAAASELQDQVGRLMPLLAQFSDAADAKLPEIGAGFDSLSDRGREMLAQLEELRERLESQIALLRDSAAAFERDHDAVVGLSSTLAGHFTEARGVVADIHASTEQTAIAAASRMVENVMQVRQSVNATSQEIRSLLTEVVTEAEQALDEFASTKAEAAFGAPIRLQIVSLEDAAVRAAEAASGASERVTTRLLELMQTISETEARIDEVDTRMDVRARDTLAARSLRLVDSLNSASFDVARLLSVDIGDADWSRFMKGDRSLFARTTVRMADKETSRKIARHFEYDEAFREEAARYLDQFETLIKRVLKDPDGESFGLILLSSDIGKLYVLIAQAIGRPIARKED